MGITFLQFLCAKCLMEWRWEEGGGRAKTVRVILLSHLPNEHVCALVSNAGNGRRARRERGTVVQRSKPHMFFVSYMCFLSQLCPNLRVTQKRGGRKTHPSPHRRWRARRWEEEEEGGLRVSFFPKNSLMLFMFGIVCVHFPP